MTPKVTVAIARLGGEWKAEDPAFWPSWLPAWRQNELGRYVRPGDRLRGFAASFLLKQLIAMHFGESGGVSLASLARDSLGRYETGTALDVGVSHSGEVVLAAASTQARIGIDVEPLRALNPADYGEVFPPERMALVLAAPDPAAAFLSAWTRLEAALKADGRGFLAPAAVAAWEEERLEIDSRRWYLTEFQPSPGYLACLAADSKVVDISFHDYSESLAKEEYLCRR